VAGGRAPVDFLKLARAEDLRTSGKISGAPVAEWDGERSLGPRPAGRCPISREGTDRAAGGRSCAETTYIESLMGRGSQERLPRWPERADGVCPAADASGTPLSASSSRWPHGAGIAARFIHRPGPMRPEPMAGRQVARSEHGYEVGRRISSGSDKGPQVPKAGCPEAGPVWIRPAGCEPGVRRSLCADRCRSARGAARSMKRCALPNGDYARRAAAAVNGHPNWPVDGRR